ncbi:MAG: hypothetical protein ACF8QF_14565 [Phycisphaerales bacterium]
MIGGALLPAWGVLPLTALMMLVVAGHIEVTRVATRPESRRRIRIANGWVMLVTLPLLASGFSLLDPDTQRRTFVLVWVAAVWLLGVSLLLAIADVFNTIRVTRKEREQLRHGFEELTRDIARLRREGRHTNEGRRADDQPSA